jgi:hypothetical protein
MCLEKVWDGIASGMGGQKSESLFFILEIMAPSEYLDSILKELFWFFVFKSNFFETIKSFNHEAEGVQSEGMTTLGFILLISNFTFCF